MKMKRFPNSRKFRGDLSMLEPRPILVVPFVWAVCFLVLGPALRGQSELEGTVMDAGTGEPLAGAAVYCSNRPGRGVSSAPDGNFVLEAEQTDTLLVAYLGYEVGRFPLAGLFGKRLTVLLVREASTIDLIEVRAEPLISREFNTRSISKLEIYTNPSAKADPLLAVQSLPSETSSEETANISLRGSSPSETTILFNNVPIRDAVKLDQANGLGQFSVFNTALVSSVEVFTANPPLEFGAATSGVVALYSNKRVASNSYSLTLSAAGLGIFTGRKLSTSSSLTAYANWSSHHLLRGLNRRSLESIQSFGTADGGVYLVADSENAGQFRFFNYTLYENYRYALEEPTFRGIFDQFKLKNQSILNWSLPLRKGRLEVNQGLNVSKSDYEAGNLENHLANLDYFVDGSYRLVDAGWSLKMGMAYTFNRLDLEAIYPRYSHAFGPQYPAEPYEEVSRLRVPEAFLYTKRYLGEHFVLGVGGRYHPRTNGMAPYLSWQGNLNYRPEEQHSWLLAGGTYHKWVPPGPDFNRSTLVRSRHLALDYRFTSEKWSLQAAVYGKKSSWDQVENRIRGVEGLASYSSLPFSASLSIASVNSVYRTAEGDYPTPYDFGHYLRLLVKFNIPGWFEINTVLKHREGRYFQPLVSAGFDARTQTYLPEFVAVAEGERLPDYRTWDLSLSRTVSLGASGLVIFASLNNVLDFKNIRRFSYSFDYSEKREEYYNRRVFFMGGVWSFGS